MREIALACTGNAFFAVSNLVKSINWEGWGTLQSMFGDRTKGSFQVRIGQGNGMIGGGGFSRDLQNGQLNRLDLFVGQTSG
uniref:CIA30 domain-containing protein n=1 Tax=Panagrellus redivivus TaxID=6233 RepID=A0A7E4VYT3_PANRE